MPERESSNFEMPGRPEEGQQKPRSETFNRRDFFKVIGGSVAAELLKPRPAEAAPAHFSTGPLAGRKFGDLYSDYTGIAGKVPETANIDYNKQLSSLWELKNHKSKNNPVVVSTGRKLVEEYKTKTRNLVDLRRYITQIDAIIAEVKNNIDWHQYAKLKNLNPQKLKLAQELCSGFHGKDLMAYSLTELMPSSDGQLNKDAMNFLLSTAGAQYVESIPAIHDPKTSFGPYQFTEFALYDAHGDRRGASIPNAALKKGKLPGSVAGLRGGDHHKAAYLFVIDNMTNLVRHASEKQLRTLERIKNLKHPDFVYYSATAHHGPGKALSIAKRWLDNGAKAPYKISCGRTYRKLRRKNRSKSRSSVKLKINY